MLSRLSSALRRLADSIDGDSDTITFRIAIDPENEPLRVRERFEARARAEKEAAELRERIARLEASRQEPPPPPLPRREPGRFVRLADMAGEGFTSEQLLWLLGVAPLGFLVCCHWQGWSAPVIVDRKSFNRWLEAYGGAGVVRECLPATMPQEDREFHVRTRAFDNPLSADHLESLRPQLDLHFSDEAIEKRFQDARIGRFPLEVSSFRTLEQIRTQGAAAAARRQQQAVN